tara:strand:+ start:748 stop:1017 length:270 start_codon:yes stop_codon:yes gene_type:complete
MQRDQVPGIREYYAISIDDVSFAYECPYDKKICPSVVHFHGSKGELHNRKEHRSSHCLGDDQVIVHIDDDTLRKTCYTRGRKVCFKKTN